MWKPQLFYAVMVLILGFQDCPVPISGVYSSSDKFRMWPMSLSEKFMSVNGGRIPGQWGGVKAGH
jgi:hypothetical protein